RDERAPPAALLDRQVPGGRTHQHGLEVLLVARDAEVVDPRQPPVAGLADGVDRAALERRQAQLEALAVELLPRRARLDRAVAVPDPAVARDELEAELADVPGLQLAHLARHQVVVEEVPRCILSVAARDARGQRRRPPRGDPGRRTRPAVD